MTLNLSSVTRTGKIMQDNLSAYTLFHTWLFTCVTTFQLQWAGLRAISFGRSLVTFHFYYMSTFQIFGTYFITFYSTEVEVAFQHVLMPALKLS